MKFIKLDNYATVMRIYNFVRLNSKQVKKKLGHCNLAITLFRWVIVCINDSAEPV